MELEKPALKRGPKVGSKRKKFTRIKRKKFTTLDFYAVIVIPSEIEKLMGWEEVSRVDIYVDEDSCKSWHIKPAKEKEGSVKDGSYRLGKHKGLRRLQFKCNSKFFDEECSKKVSFRAKGSTLIIDN